MEHQVLKQPQKLKFESTLVMGVLNVTPDSFSDGGKFFDRTKAIEHGRRMAREGAHIIDVGGESTRPGARDVGVEEELDRVIPVIEVISKETGILISVDTRKSKVAKAAIAAGARMVNDISGLKYDKEMPGVVSKNGAYIIIMHSKGTPQDMQIAPAYKNLIREMIDSLKGSVSLARSSGVAEENIIIDPGIGFGKTVRHNLEILRCLSEFKALGRPICVGTSRKSFIGHILGSAETGDRLAGTLATCVIAIMNGANILRVHDVKEIVRAVKITDSILKTKAD